jgi:hypothetical protein
MDYFKKMRTYLLFVFLFFGSSVMAQTLKDSLFGGKIKADTGRTFISKDTSKYLPPKVYNASPSIPGETKKNEITKLDESMPDSLNKTFYAKQKTWKRFIDVNTSIISQQAADTRKVKKGQYSIDIEYEIGLNGRVTTTGVTCNPPNEYLAEQVSEFMKRPPILVAPVYSDGKPRKLNATQTITIIKK